MNISHMDTNVDKGEGVKTFEAQRNTSGETSYVPTSIIVSSTFKPHLLILLLPYHHLIHLFQLPYPLPSYNLPIPIS